MFSMRKSSRALSTASSTLSVKVLQPPHEQATRPMVFRGTPLLIEEISQRGIITATKPSDQKNITQYIQNGAGIYVSWTDSLTQAYEFGYRGRENNGYCYGSVLRGNLPPYYVNVHRHPVMRNLVNDTSMLSYINHEREIAAVGAVSLENIYYSQTILLESTPDPATWGKPIFNSNFVPNDVSFEITSADPEEEERFEAHAREKGILCEDERFITSSEAPYLHQTIKENCKTLLPKQEDIQGSHWIFYKASKTTTKEELAQQVVEAYWKFKTACRNPAALETTKLKSQNTTLLLTVELAQNSATMFSQTVKRQKQDMANDRNMKRLTI